MQLRLPVLSPGPVAISITVPSIIPPIITSIVSAVITVSWTAAWRAGTTGLSWRARALWRTGWAAPRTALFLNWFIIDKRLFLEKLIKIIWHGRFSLFFSIVYLM